MASGEPAEPADDSPPAAPDGPAKGPAAPEGLPFGIVAPVVPDECPSPLLAALEGLGLMAPSHPAPAVGDTAASSGPRVAARVGLAAAREAAEVGASAAPDGPPAPLRPGAPAPSASEAPAAAALDEAPQQAAAPRPGASAPSPEGLAADPAAGRARETAAPRPDAPRPAPPPEPAPDRAADILRQMRLQLSPQLRQATLQLEPEHLGRIAVRIALRGGEVRAELRVESDATLAVLQRHAPELRALLEQSGLGGGELELSLAWSDPGGGDAPAEGGARPRGGPRREDEAPEPLRRALARAATSGSGVDTYA